MTTPSQEPGRHLAVSGHAASLAEGWWLITAAVLLPTFMEVLDAKERMGNVTSLFNMMRNIGGGVGYFLGANHDDSHGAGAYQLACRQYHTFFAFGAATCSVDSRVCLQVPARSGPTSKLTPPSLGWCSAKPLWWRSSGFFNIWEC